MAMNTGTATRVDTALADPYRHTLVIGATGTTGSRVAAQLAAGGHRVMAAAAAPPP